MLNNIYFTINFLIKDYFKLLPLNSFPPSSLWASYEKFFHYHPQSCSKGSSNFPNDFL